jgi:uncharacterized membrane protein (DUF373 family)
MTADPEMKVNFMKNFCCYIMRLVSCIRTADTVHIKLTVMLFQLTRNT